MNKGTKIRFIPFLIRHIISYSKKKIILEEGCLSLPKQYAEIERSEEIEVRIF